MTTMTKEQRRARRVAREQAKQPKVYVAACNRPITMTKSVVADEILRRLLRKLDGMEEHALSNLQRFSDKLTNDNAYYAFDWSGNARKAAAQKQVVDTIRRYWATAQERDDGYEGGVLPFVKYTREWIHSDLIQNVRFIDNKSDLERFSMAAYAEIYESMDFYFKFYERELAL